jgi:hypothetical protein
MDLLEHIEFIEKLILSKSFSTEKVSEEIDKLMNKLLNEVILTSDIDAAGKIINIWESEFIEDYKSKYEIIYDHAEFLKKSAERLNEKVTKENRYFGSLAAELSNLEISLENFEKLGAIIDKYKQIGIPETSFDDIEKPEKELKLVYDFSVINKLVKQSPFIGKLDLFIKKSKQSLKQAKRRFKFFKFLVSFLKACVICLGFIVSYYIGKLFDSIFGDYIMANYKIEINPLWIAFASFIICFMTSDKWMEKIKEQIFWKYAKEISESSKQVYLQFLKLKVEYLTAATDILNNQ